MYIRVIGNSASGKTTLAKSLASKYNFELLHLDSIAFIPDSCFVKKSEEEILNDYIEFIKCCKDPYIIDGNYIDITSRVHIVPDLIIFTDLPIEQSTHNFKKHFEKFKNTSRPELPNLIETNPDDMVEWIESYKFRYEYFNNYVQQCQMINPNMDVLILTDMSEVKAVCNNPLLIDDFIR